MTENSEESTKPSTDTINVLPILSKADAPVSLTLTIDKSVSKIAGWIVALLIALTSICAICATVTVMTVRGSQDREREVNNQLIVSQNHWRDMEVKQKANEAEIDRLQQELRDVHRR